MADITNFIPHGILSTDHWHRGTNDGACSRCRALISNYDVPLMLFSASGDDMVIYCQACLTSVPAANDNRGEKVAMPVAHGMGKDMA